MWAWPGDWYIADKVECRVVWQNRSKWLREFQASRVGLRARKRWNCWAVSIPWPCSPQCMMPSLKGRARLLFRQIGIRAPVCAKLSGQGKKKCASPSRDLYSRQYTIVIKNIGPRAKCVYVESCLCHLSICDLVFLNFQIVFLIYKMGIIAGPIYRWLWEFTEYILLRTVPETQLAFFCMFVTVVHSLT